jgi:hypothetical protein
MLQFKNSYKPATNEKAKTGQSLVKLNSLKYSTSSNCPLWSLFSQFLPLLSTSWRRCMKRPYGTTKKVLNLK